MSLERMVEWEERKARELRAEFTRFALKCFGVLCFVTFLGIGLIVWVL